MLSLEAGGIIQERREEIGLSQLDLAVAARVSIATISNIETSKNRTPSRRVLNAIAKELKLKTDALKEPKAKVAS